jgi:site-specific DNA-methyltransferase (adenine-specific)
MNTGVMFSRASDEWETPPDVFAALDAEFRFGLDVAATATNRKTPLYLGPDRADAWTDALVVNWTQAAAGTACFMNPPYSRCRPFIAKAATEARCGTVIVALVPARTDTHWWHDHVWDAQRHAPRTGVEVRFLRGRLKFSGMPTGAPFPSVVVVFRPDRPA